MRNRDRVQGIVYMEAIITPLTWADWPENARRAFQRSDPKAVKRWFWRKTYSLNGCCPAPSYAGPVRRRWPLTAGPTLIRADRRPTLTWPRMIPKVVENYAAWLAESHVPKLFINADPGSILVGRQREICRAWPNQTEVTVKGRHFVQEDSAGEIGQAVADFVHRVRSQ